MRRALLTARPAAPAVPVSVGNTGTFGTTALSSLRTAVDLTDPATATSTVTSAAVDCAAGTIYVMVGALTGADFTVRSISGPLTAVTGFNTLTVSLPVVIGDLIGFWAPGSGGVSGRYAAGIPGHSIGYNLSSPTSAPGPGSVIPLTMQTDWRLSIRGTG